MKEPWVTINEIDESEPLWLYWDEPYYHLEGKTKTTRKYRNEWGLKYVFNKRNSKSKFVKRNGVWYMKSLVLTV